MCGSGAILKSDSEQLLTQINTKNDQLWFNDHEQISISLG